VGLAKKILVDRIIDKLSLIYDPEIPVNIYELGLVYLIEVGNDRTARIVMTLTSPNCPEAENIPVQVERSVLAIEGIEKVTVEIVWDPPWNYEMMSDAARLELGIM
jgi:FeS assembly SUF system protein